MAGKEEELQELIVRALTGKDPTARLALDQAAAADPELKAFCRELEQITALLDESRNWRGASPSVTLSKRIRAEVVAKLPQAPPHFEMVVLEQDLGRRRAVRLGWLAGVLLALAGVGAYFLASRPWQAEDGSRFQGQFVRRWSLGQAGWEDWARLGEGRWEAVSGGAALRGEGQTGGALVLRQGYPSQRPWAMEWGFSHEGLGEGAQIRLFLAEGLQEAVPDWDGDLRAKRTLVLEFSRTSLVLLGARQALLHSEPRDQSVPGQYLVRFEWQRERLVVFLNGRLFFEGPLPEPFDGSLHPGILTRGGGAAGMVFKSVRIEQ